MIRFVGPLLLLLYAAQAASAQPWAAKMFEEKSHDFGTVGRGAKAEFEFKFKNIYVEDVHISSVRSSCGCTSPTVSKSRLKTNETASIIAKYNTRSFLGAKSATITVKFDEPYPAEVQLNVTGFIRGDVVFYPGSVDFGSVTQGTSAQKKISVTYAGRSDWQIVDVTSEYEHCTVYLSDRKIGTDGLVSYEMEVELKPSAPPGYIHTELQIVSDDTKMKSIPLSIEGRVLSALTVTPSSLYLGNLEPGQQVTKQLAVSAKEPFQILDVSCGDECFSFKIPKDSKKLHFIPVTFTADEKTGKISGAIHIKTDFGAGTVCNCTATANVKPAD